MRFVGIDLAWGGRRPSGLAVLDPGGAVVAEGGATGDEEIGGFLAVHDPGGAVVALDAPLVVGNPAGTRRGCEAELQRRYGRVGAGPYPTNLGLLEGRVRAMELVRRSARPYVTVPRAPGRGTGWGGGGGFPPPARGELGGRGGGGGGGRGSGGGGGGPPRRCGSTRRRPWPGSWAGWTGCGARG